LELFIAGLYFTFFEKTYKNNGLIIHIPFDLTNFQFRGRFALNRYEVEEAKYIDKYLSKDARVLELGGCLGYVSCLINKKLLDKTQQVTLEANPKLIGWIKKNRDENDCSFFVENSIVSHENKNIFYFHNRIVGGSTKRKTANKAYVKGVDIEFLKKKYNIEFDTLIMDIEGGELDIIKNFKESLSNFKRIFLEVHPFGGILTYDEVKTCENILSSIGFCMIVRDANFQIWNKKLNNG
jgi:FkbM family methyltransferase